MRRGKGLLVLDVVLGFLMLPAMLMLVAVVAPSKPDAGIGLPLSTPHDKLVDDSRWNQPITDGVKDKRTLIGDRSWIIDPKKAPPSRESGEIARSVVVDFAHHEGSSFLSSIIVPDRVTPFIGDQGLQGGWAVDNAGNINFDKSVVATLPQMQEAGAGWVRINFRLGSCFTDWVSVGCNGKTALQVYDAVVSAAQGRGLKVLDLLSNESWPGSQPQWVENNAENTSGNGDNAYLRAFSLGAAVQLARRFSGRVTSWEVWNEPNAWWYTDGAGRYWGGDPSSTLPTSHGFCATFTRTLVWPGSVASSLSQVGS